MDMHEFFRVYIKATIPLFLLKILGVWSSYQILWIFKIGYMNYAHFSKSGQILASYTMQLQVNWLYIKRFDG